MPALNHRLNNNRSYLQYFNTLRIPSGSYVYSSEINFNLNYGAIARVCKQLCEFIAKVNKQVVPGAIILLRHLQLELSNTSIPASGKIMNYRPYRNTGHGLFQDKFCLVLFSHRSKNHQFVTSKLDFLNQF